MGENTSIRQPWQHQLTAAATTRPWVEALEPCSSTIVRPVLIEGRSGVPGGTFFRQPHHNSKASSNGPNLIVVYSGFLCMMKSHFLLKDEPGGAWLRKSLSHDLGCKERIPSCHVCDADSSFPPTPTFAPASQSQADTLRDFKGTSTCRHYRSPNVQK